MVNTAIMEVDVDWDDDRLGYVISYNCPDFDRISPNEGNGDLDDFYDNAVEETVLNELTSIGIPTEAIESR